MGRTSPFSIALLTAEAAAEAKTDEEVRLAAEAALAAEATAAAVMIPKGRWHRDATPAARSGLKHCRLANVFFSGIMVKLWWNYGGIMVKSMVESWWNCGGSIFDFLCFS